MFAGDARTGEICRVTTLNNKSTRNGRLVNTPRDYFENGDMPFKHRDVQSFETSQLALSKEMK